MEVDGTLMSSWGLPECHFSHSVAISKSNQSLPLFLAKTFQQKGGSRVVTHMLEVRQGECECVSECEVPAESGPALLWAFRCGV